jgi:hypothetical protein
VSDLRVALISAITGGALGIIGGLIGAWFSAGAARGREEHRAKRELVAAARLIDEELRNAYDAAQSISGGAAYVQLPVRAWEQERVRLAGAPEVDAADWETMKTAYDRIRGFNWRCEARLLSDETEKASACEKIIAAVPPARHALTRYSTH